jgi:hypothetical protein
MVERLSLWLLPMRGPRELVKPQHQDSEHIKGPRAIASPIKLTRYFGR